MPTIDGGHHERVTSPSGVEHDVSTGVLDCGVVGNQHRVRPLLLHLGTRIIIILVV